MSLLQKLVLVGMFSLLMVPEDAFAGGHGCGGCRRGFGPRGGGVAVAVRIGGCRGRMCGGCRGGGCGFRGGYGYPPPFGFHRGYGRFPRAYFPAPIRNSLFGFRPNRITPVRQFLFGRGQARRMWRRGYYW